MKKHSMECGLRSSLSTCEPRLLVTNVQMQFQEIKLH